jgi:hypothetical protein
MLLLMNFCKKKLMRPLLHVHKRLLPIAWKSMPRRPKNWKKIYMSKKLASSTNGGGCWSVRRAYGRTLLD